MWNQIDQLYKKCFSLLLNFTMSSSPPASKSKGPLFGKSCTKKIFLVDYLTIRGPRNHVCWAVLSSTGLEFHTVGAALEKIHPPNRMILTKKEGARDLIWVVLTFDWHLNFIKDKDLKFGAEEVLQVILSLFKSRKLAKLYEMVFCKASFTM